MRTCLRAVLVAAAVLSSMAFPTPALAGMIPTPAPREGAERELALQALKARAAEWGVPAEVAGKGLERLETRELVALAESCESMRAAGYHAQLIVGIVLILAGCCCGVWLVVDSLEDRHHHHH
ncbi:MAG: hypothetical protein HYY18_03095 [Planctomycetes bacterium]|nr:hypothetical protein [Planctomycetota bacterium]